MAWEDISPPPDAPPGWAWQGRAEWARRIRETPQARAVTVAAGMTMSDELAIEVNMMRDAYLAALTELASARAELEAVRTARDTLDRQLAVAHADIEELDRDVKLCPRCGVTLAAELADEQAREPESGGRP